MNIEKIKEEQNEILSGWNGEDSTFYVNGESYTEDDVNKAEDILEAIKSLEELINE
jgi:hypothetical protein